ncbi:MAG TPA: energy transducer TonB [Steroidobacteraceae bacterium]|nr:energy transducer TonB [Steroidobacteraceae bacterium]
MFAMPRPHIYVSVVATLAIAFAAQATPDEFAEALQLGNSLAASGHHEEAVPQLQRALSLQRSRYGLFDLRQQETLKTLADSLTALNRVPEAQDLMLYRVRVAEKNYGEANPRVIPSLCDLGDWFSENLMSVEARMTFQMALNIVGATPALRDPIIIEPLRGVARTRMRALSYPQSGDGRLVFAKRREFNREGEAALKKAVQIVEADPSAIAPQTRIETLIQMGDWYQIKKSPREALAYYQRAWRVIRAAPSLPDSVTRAFDVPLRVYYPTPPIVTHIPGVAAQDTQFHHVQVEFTVAADGSVKNARIVEHDTHDRYAGDVLDAVRDSRFRPKLVDGLPVAAPALTYREVFMTGKPRN